MGVVPGLGHLPVRVEFHGSKVLARPVGSWSGHLVDSAYEIHHGIARRLAHGTDDEPDSLAVQPFLDGWKVGSVWGTMWHGAFESDGFRRAWLAEVARAAGSRWQPARRARPASRSGANGCSTPSPTPSRSTSTSMHSSP